MLICAACIVWFAAGGRPSLPTLTYSQFLEKVQTGQVSSVVLKGNNSATVQATCRLKDGTTVRTVLPSDYRNATAAMLGNNVDVEILDPSTGYLWRFVQFSPFFLLAGLWTFIMMIRPGANGRLFRSMMGR